MKRLFFAIAVAFLTLGLMAQSNPIIVGPLLTEDGDQETYIMTPTSAYNMMYVITSNTCHSTGGGGSVLYVTPHGGGHYTVTGQTTHINDPLDYQDDEIVMANALIVTVKPKRPDIDGPGYAYQYQSPEFELDLTAGETCDSYDDYDWSISGAGATLVDGGDGYDFAEVWLQSYGTLIVKSRAKMNGVWSSWKERRIPVYN